MWHCTSKDKDDGRVKWKKAQIQYCEWNGRRTYGKIQIEANGNGQQNEGGLLHSVGHVRIPGWSDSQVVRPKIEGPMRGWQLLDVPFILLLLLCRMTLTIYSWCSFITTTISWLLKTVPEIACDILDETSDYLFYFCYQFLLYFLSGFLNGLTSVSFGVNLARRQTKYQQPETNTRKVKREIKFRGLTKLHRSGLSLDRFLLVSLWSHTTKNPNQLARGYSIGYSILESNKHTSLHATK